MDMGLAEYNADHGIVDPNAPVPDPDAPAAEADGEAVRPKRRKKKRNADVKDADMKDSKDPKDAPSEVVETSPADKKPEPC